MKSDEHGVTSTGEDEHTGRGLTLRQHLEAEFLLRCASSLRPGEVLEANYVDNGDQGGCGFRVGFAGMFATTYTVDTKITPDASAFLLADLRRTRHAMAAFARGLAAAIREHGQVIATDYIGGCIAALLFEEAQKKAPAPVPKAGECYAVFARQRRIGAGSAGGDAQWTDTLIRATTPGLAKLLWEQVPEPRRSWQEIEIRRVAETFTLGGR